MKRREFLSTGAAFGAAFAGTALASLAMPGAVDAFGTGGGIDILEGLDIIERGKERNTAPVIRKEIAGNPRSVFLFMTDVRAERDARGFFSGAREQLFEAGQTLAPLVFEKGASRGGSTVLCPNFTTVEDVVADHTSGVITSPDFVAGFTEGLRALGNRNAIVSSRGASIVSHRKTGIYDAFDAHNIDFIESKYRRFADYDKRELFWHTVEDPVVWKRIPTIRPIGESDCLFVSMPKLKCHNLGLTTLSVKNLQGSVPTGHGQYCTQWSALEYMCRESYGIDFKRDFLADYYQNVEQGFLRHRADGYKHWDFENAYPAYEKKGGWEAFGKIRNKPKEILSFMEGIPDNLMWDELWCQRALDAASVITPQINIVEGIIGRDGSGFRIGRDELTNVVVIGCSMFEVDAVASYIMGHDPRELYYTRIANERGLGECDPTKISINVIGPSGISPVRSLADIRRYRLGVNMHNRQEDLERLFW